MGLGRSHPAGWSCRCVPARSKCVFSAPQCPRNAPCFEFCSSVLESQAHQNRKAPKGSMALYQNHLGKRDSLCISKALPATWGW